MQRTITVKGVGRVSAKPDTIVLTMTVESKDRNYSRAMEDAAASIEDITSAFVAAGFEKSAVKTTSFNVDAKYEQVEDRNGHWRRAFSGYAVTHDLKLEFGFDREMLSRAMNAAAGCRSHPQLSVNFTVKDGEALRGEMLRSAAQNAREKAEVLCAASGVTLGELLAIDYSWGEISFQSDTGFMAKTCAAEVSVGSIDFEPEDVEDSDTATFVWEIK